MFYLKDPKDGQPSITLTAFAVGFAVATFKMLVSGVQLGTFQMGQFGGGDFAGVVGSLGALYAARRHPGMNEPQTNTTVVVKETKDG